MTEHTAEYPYPESDPRYYTTRIKAMLNAVVDHVRRDGTRVNDPKAQALFETSAEVLLGLITAYEHYEQRSERAWQ